jgi:hypothetical protein
MLLGTVKGLEDFRSFVAEGWQYRKYGFTFGRLDSEALRPLKDQGSCFSTKVV